MRRPIDARIRQRIKERMEELSLTGREFAALVRPEDAGNLPTLDSWISGVLTGRQGLSWKYFDAVCEALRWSPSDLVRHDDATVRELRPSEMAALRHFQRWPPAVQDQALRMLDYLHTGALDQEQAAVLRRYADLPQKDRDRLRDFLEALSAHRQPRRMTP